MRAPRSRAGIVPRSVKLLTSTFKTVGFHALLAIFGLGSCGVCAGDQAIKYCTEIEPKELGVAPVELKKDPKTGFLVGGVNQSSLIKELVAFQDDSNARNQTRAFQ